MLSSTLFYDENLKKVAKEQQSEIFNKQLIITWNALIGCTVQMGTA